MSRRPTWERRREIEATIKRAILERAGKLVVNAPDRAKAIANMADDLPDDILDGLLRDWHIREKPRGSRVVS